MNKIQELIRQFVTSQNKEVMLRLIEVLQQTDMLWVAYSPVTKNHYIEYYNDVPTAFLFSEIDFCAAFESFLASKKVKVSPMECDRTARVSMFSDFFRNGVEQVIVDNGQTFVTISLTDIINKPDFSAIPFEQRPVLNPELMKNANIFFQSQNTEEKSPRIQGDFMRSLYQAKYLLPLVLDGQAPKGTVIRPMRIGSASLTIPVIEKAGGGCYMPVFTDWVEFSKMDKQKTCVGNIVTFEDIASFCQAGEYLVINPLGFNMILDQTTVNAVQRRFGTSIQQTEQTAAQTSPVQQKAPPRFEFYELENVPETMLQKLTESLRYTQGIKKAYLKGLRQKGRPSYLCIVDFSGTNPAVFQQMAQEIGAFTGGVALNFVDYNSEIGHMAVGQSVPFFTR